MALTIRSSSPARRRLAAAGLVALVGLAPQPARAVTITIHNGDAPGKGFNDPSARTPVGGNPGTTLGAQRLYLFQYAAEIWGLRVQGDVPVIVTASFAALGGTSVSAILGAARPVSFDKGFPGAPLSQTWYAQALANQLAGYDRNDLLPGSCPEVLVGGHCPEIATTFNSDVDNSTVLGSVDFYYGLDGNSGSDIDFLSVLLHELGHGLGLISLIDPDSGKISPDPSVDTCTNCSDAYSNNLEDPTINPKKVASMAANQRKIAIVDDGKLAWVGAAAESASSVLTSGVRADGAVQIFAPKTYISGSSVSHLNTTILPNELMEPYLSNPEPRSLTFTIALLGDIGWETYVPPRCGDANADKKFTATDALVVLKGAVGSAECPDYTCNVNFTGGLTASDALIVLKYAVGQPVTLNCPLA